MENNERKYNISLSNKANQAPSLGEGGGGFIGSKAPSLREGGGGCQEHGGVGLQETGTAGCCNYVCECNRAFNAETLHPLVSLIDMSAPCSCGCIKTDCYSVVLKHRAGDCVKYGRRHYDFADATMLFVTPRKDVDLCTNDGKMLIFHPDLVRCTPLGMKLGDYTFFKYRQDESLHISCCEERVVERCLGSISDELAWGVDEYSKPIICTAIELLLGYCRRFYTRQFITRHDANVDAIAALDKLIDGAFASGEIASSGLPTASRLAPRLDMSACYLDDMLKSETGCTVTEYVRLRRIKLAKRMLMAGDRSVDEISYLLGFSNVKCFAVVFKKVTGVEPCDYR